MMEPQPQRFCQPSELGNPQRTRASTFPQRRRLRLSNWDKLLNARQSYISTDCRAEPENLRLPPDKRGKKPKPFVYPAQFMALLELIPEPYASMVFVAVWTGLRVSELCARKWSSIHAHSITVS